MAGTSSPEPVSLDPRPEAERRPSPTQTAEAWRLTRPFAHLAHDDRLDYLREHGMHGNVRSFRVGSDAFEIRPDIEVGDACETAAQYLQALIGTLDLLAMAPGASDIQQQTASGCALLARQTAGALAVITAGVFPGDQARFASNDA